MIISKNPLFKKSFVNFQILFTTFESENIKIYNNLREYY